LVGDSGDKDHLIPEQIDHFFRLSSPEIACQKTIQNDSQSAKKV